MNTTKKVILAILVFGLLAGAFLLRKYLTGQEQRKEYAFTITIKTPGDFSCTLNPTALVLTKGEIGTITITNTVSGGWDQPLKYSIEGQIPIGSYSFSKNPVNPGETCILTIDSSKLQSGTTYMCSLVVDP
jgi:hypothetical protein